jgi:hypothetical protein
MISGAMAWRSCCATASSIQIRLQDVALNHASWFVDILAAPRTYWL